jgi:outer membrane protein OmpA-like peptidoglycan-associated protein
MSVNLLELATAAMGGNFSSLAGNLMGESEGATKSAIGAALPALLGGLVSKGGSLDGASGLLSMLNGPNINAGLLSNLGSLFSNGGTQANSLMGVGSGLLGSLFGDKVGGLANAVSGLAGIKGSSATNLLGLLAPLVFGLLKNQTTSHNLGASGLMDLLKGQSAHLGKAIDPKISSALGFASPLAFLGGGVDKVAAAATAGMGAAAAGLGSAASTATAAASSGGSSIMRWLPLLIGVAAVLWLLSQMNSCSGAKKVETPAPTPPVVSAPAPAPVVEKVPEPTPATPAPAAVAMPANAKIYFGVNSYEPPADLGQQLDAIVTYARSSANTKISVSGFHDKTGDPAKNAELAKQRAKSVANALVSAGIPEDRLMLQKPQETTGGGDDKEARRVEVSASQ